MRSCKREEKNRAATGRTLRTIGGSWNDHRDAVTLVDAHHRLWGLNVNYYPWLSDSPSHISFWAIIGRCDATGRLPTGYAAAQRADDGPLRG